MNWGIPPQRACLPSTTRMSQKQKTGRQGRFSTECEKVGREACRRVNTRTSYKLWENNKIQTSCLYAERAWRNTNIQTSRSTLWSCGCGYQSRPPRSQNRESATLIVKCWRTLIQMWTEAGSMTRACRCLLWWTFLTLLRTGVRQSGRAPLLDYTRT